MVANISKDIKSLSFEEALKELETITRSLETGEASLEDSIKLFEHGSKLKAYCDDKLRAAQMKVEQIVESSEGIKTENYIENK